jgi:hypothetical protein
MIHNRKARIAARREDAIERARRVLQNVHCGALDAYEGYRRVYAIYVGSNGLAEELRPFFRLPGIEPDRFLHVDDEFRATIRRLAGEWLRGEWPSPLTSPELNDMA